MSLKKTPFSFLSTIFSVKSIENEKFENSLKNRINLYDNIKGLKILEFGDFKILNVLVRGLSSIVCLCEWNIDSSKELFSNKYVNYINNDILNNINFNHYDSTSIEKARRKNYYINNTVPTEIKENEKLETCDLTDIEKLKNENEIENLKKDSKKKTFTNKCNNRIMHLVLKLKHKGLYYKISEIQQLREEISIHKNLNHSNILKLILCGEDENDIWVLFEYSSIGDLYSYVGFKTLEENEVKIIVSQLLFSLYYLHINGIIHCDIKPQNILLFPFHVFLLELNDPLDIEKVYNSQNIKLNINKLVNSVNKDSQYSQSNIFKNIIKLCDFSLSVKCEFNKFYPFRGIKGSYGYIAPELFKECGFNNKIDMWALGIIAFVLLGGYKPFYPYSKFEEKITFHERYWHNISSDAKDFISSLLKIIPSERFNVIEAMHHSWIKDYFIIT